MPPKRSIVLAFTLIFSFALAAPAALAQEYTTPTTPQYQTPNDDSGAAPDDDSGDTPADEAPANDNAPDTGAGAPSGDTATLPRTGSELPAFLTVFGLVLLLSGFAVRRGLRPFQ